MHNNQQGMALPFMLVFLAILTLLAGKIYSLAEQQRGGVRVLVQRNQAMIKLRSAEDFVLRKIPLLDIALYQRLSGKSETAPVTFSFILPEGEISAEVRSAQTCLNIAPLEENDAKTKRFTGEILTRLLKTFQLPESIIDDFMSGSDKTPVLPEDLTRLICYLPGAGQQWQYTHLNLQHLPLLNAALPDTAESVLKSLLQKGVKASDAAKINESLQRELFVADSQFYWLSVTADQSSTTFYARSLVKINGRSAHIIMRRLLNDGAL
jgi:hypothetical protein